ncbi:hypothetical protein FHR83_007039 [Actinoplanes campanulatus]|uniref:Uncharacterized protein n=1 Tax=Actinoplanes campanulatus TaxID=113559 RepID=A0A7W5AN34_9ACTN|nr:hypothetical protein [Actinoplanes campanulatus]MBB3099333.1 hypothetical protein [Actinoplanes campanulatus]GGN40440.1 hypothetical protein GCM10010109_69530 [Actinoplanes campanulatus]GID40650.1 hypothetical protein Aca09nite_71560 [Actinoplanes campanulatus]
MTEPIAFTTTRYRCPHCPRTGAVRARVRDHIGRCWTNPAARGCKTCTHYRPPWDDTCDAPQGCVGCASGDESCAAGVSLAGRPECERCHGANQVFTGEIFRPRFGVGGPVYAQCPECGGNGRAVKAGPIVHCDLWALAEPDEGEPGGAR